VEVVEVDVVVGAAVVDGIGLVVVDVGGLKSAPAVSTTLGLFDRAMVALTPATATTKAPRTVQRTRRIDGVRLRRSDARRPVADRA